MTACGDNSSPDPSIGIATLTGSVSITGATDLSGLVITAAGPTSASVVTAADGTYKLTNLETGTYTILATAPSTRERVIASTASVESDTAAADPIAFAGLGSVSGRVTRGSATTGNGGITVVVSGSSGAAITDDTGAFVIEDVTAGDHVFVASTSGFAGATSATFQVGYRQVVQPASLVLASTAATGSIAGKVVLDGESDHHGVAVLLAGPAAGAAVTDATGAYSIPGLPNGNYTLTVAGDSTLEGTRTNSIAVANGALTTAADVHLTPVGRLAGTVSLGGGANANAGTFVYIAGGPATVTSDTGAFELVGVKTGAYTVQAVHTGYSDDSKTDQVVTYRDTTAVPSITLTAVATAGARTITGIASPIGSTPGAGTTVTLRGTGKQLTTTNTGGYEFADLDDGVYTLDFANGAYGASMTNVIALAGGHGFIVNDGQLAEVPNVEMPRGTRLAMTPTYGSSPNHTFFLGQVDKEIFTIMPDGTTTKVADGSYAGVTDDDYYVRYMGSDGKLRFVRPTGGTPVVQSLEDSSNIVWWTSSHTHYMTRRCASTCEYYSVSVGGGAIPLGVDDHHTASSLLLVSIDWNNREVSTISLLDGSKRSHGTLSTSYYYGHYVQLSTDGSYILFNSPAGLTVAATSGNATPIVASPLSSDGCTFSLDNKYAACRMSNGVPAVVDLATGATVAMPAGQWATLSADNTTVFVQTYNSDFLICSATTGEIIQDVTDVDHFALMPDLNAVVVRYSNYVLGVVPMTGGPEVQLSTNVSGWGWSPDSQTIALQRFDGHRLIVPRTGGTPRDLGTGQFPSFSPDSSRLVWHDDDGVIVTSPVAGNAVTAWNRASGIDWAGNALMLNRSNSGFLSGSYFGIVP